MNLTKPQQLIYDAERVIGGTIAVMCGIMTVNKVYPEAQIIEAIQTIYETNDALNLKLDDSGTVPQMYYDSPHGRTVNIVRVQQLSELDAIGEATATTPFDLHGWLSELTAVIHPNGYGIIVKLHHLLGDAWSMSLIGTQLNAILEGTPWTRYSYETYVNAEKDYLQSKRYERDRAFFLHAFETCSEPVLLSDKQSGDYRTQRLRRYLPIRLRDALRVDAEKTDHSEFVSLLSAFAVLYGKMKNCVSSFFVGMPVLNRMSEKELHTVGMYVNTVPVPICLDYEKSFAENLQQIENSVVSVFKHQKFNYNDILNAVREHCGFQGKLYDCAVNYQPDEILSGQKMHSEEYTRGMQAENLQLFFQNRNREDGLVLEYIYRTDIFSSVQISRFHTMYLQVLELLVSNAEQPLREVSILTDEDRSIILNVFNDTNVPCEKPQSVCSRIHMQAQCAPDKTAVIATDRTLTYAQLREEAGRVAKGLQDHGVKTGDIVAFRLPRDSRLFCAMLGILQAGAAYLPQDPQQPEERLEYILKDSGAKLCITEENYAGLLAREALQQPVPVKGTDLCYCIYTSGSTGAPKGTLLTQQNVLNYLGTSKRHMNGGVLPADCESVLSVTSVGFDIFVTESLLPLANGKTVVFADEQQSQFGAELQQLLQKHPVDVMQTTPSKMRVFLHGITDKTCLQQMQCIVLGGETLDKSLVEELTAFTPAKIWNVYGPTEATVWATFTEVKREEDITIGKPLANTQIFILDKYLQPVPIGVTGELCIAGDCVGAGYLNRPELTIEKFIDNPFGEGKLYKTGDLAYWREDGNVVFVGRNDFQIKINGQRVELGEIEAALSGVDGIESAAVIVRKDENDRQMLCAFYTGKETAGTELRGLLAHSLPRYMIPQVFIHLDQMPLNTSGKIDRAALPDVDLDALKTTTVYVAPQTEAETILISTAMQILHNNHIGMLDNFFDLGGDSLKSIAWISLLEKQGYTLSSEDIFNSIDLAAIAKKLRATESEDEIEPDYPKYLPLTAAQKEIYTAQAIVPDQTVYNISYIIRVQALDVQKLQNAVDCMLKRHEILRSFFENINGELTQATDENAHCTVEPIVGNITDFIRPFDLSKAPLIRVGYQDHTIVFDLHHIVADGSSMPVFFRDLNEFYMGRIPEFSFCPYPYKYFAATQTIRPEDEAYWEALFADDVPVLTLRTDLPRPSVRTYAGETVYHQLPKATNERISDFCRAQGITPFVYCYGVFQILLQKFSGLEDIVVGTPVSGRSAKNLHTIGMFVHTLPLRCKPEGNKTVKQFFREVRDLSLEAARHTDAAVSAIAARKGRSSLFDVMFTYQAEEMTTFDFGDKPAEIIPVSLPVSKYDFDFTLYPRKEGAVLAAAYNTSLFRTKTIEQMMCVYEKILMEALNANKKLCDIAIMEERERHQLLYTFNDTAVPYSKDKSVYDLFLQQVQKAPQEVQIQDESTAYSFAQLDSDASKLDAYIRSMVGCKKQVIGVLCNRSYEQLVAIFGIVRGGNAYLPVSPQYPPERIHTMLETSGCKLVLAQKQYLHLTDKACNVEDLLQGVLPDSAPSPAAMPQDTLYVIYTSGSTGTPKGAMVSNRSAVNRIQWMANRFFDETSVVMLKTPYTFDVSVWEIFGFAMFGFSLYILPPDAHYKQNEVLSHIEKGLVTDLHFVPTVFEQFLAALKKEKDPQTKLQSLRHIILSGEALSAHAVNAFRSYHNGQVTIHNLYGPAECTVDVTAYTCAETETDPVPIGKPIDNTQIYITDQYMHPVPIGVTGELCIAGENVGQGYINDPARTNEAFIPNPFGEGKLYKTGDRAWWREDGNIVFVGRNDFQVKINGQRVELGEIEAALSGVDGIESAAVIVRKDENDRQLLCAFYTGKETAGTELRGLLAHSLPRYMVPQAFMHLDQMPLNTSGKIDHLVLAALPLSLTKVNSVYHAPENETEQTICDAFAVVLGQKEIGREANFYDLGGTSLQLVQLLSFSPLDALTPSEFLTDPTPAGLAKKLDAEAGIDYTYIVPLYTSSQAQKAMVLFPYAGGDAAAYTALAARAREEQSDVSLYFVDWPDEKNLQDVAREICALSEKMRVGFYSHCAGAVAALRLLDMMNRDRQRIGTYIVGASIPPRRQKVQLNPWQFLPDGILLRILRYAGLSAAALEPLQTKAILRRFRNNTDEYYRYFSSKNEKTPCCVHLIISKKDPFTKNYMQAESLWRQYVTQVGSVTLIETPTHYFQSIDTDRLLELIQTLI